MLTAASEKLAFQLYDRLWGLAMPLINRNRRLSEGIDQRLFYSCLPRPSDIWIQAASVGESFLVLEILKRLQARRASAHFADHQHGPGSGDSRESPIGTFSYKIGAFASKRLTFPLIDRGSCSAPSDTSDRP